MDGCFGNSSHYGEMHCPAVNDTFQCWPATSPNTTISGPCPDSYLADDQRAYRTCLPNGTWLGNWTNYTSCYTWEPYDHHYDITLYQVLKEVIFITSILSLVFLVVALFIFCYFRSIQCSRISIHKQLVLSFIINFSISVYKVQPNPSSYREVDWLCKTIVAVSKYSQMATFAWMLVEGIYLHNRLVVTVFPSAAPFRLFYFIGWGLPLVFTGVWTGLMYHYHGEDCWNDYAKKGFVFIIFIPIFLALIINCAFLVNIIRVLVVKLRCNNRMESRRIRKAIKATIILLPLLGVANLLFFAHPEGNTTLMSIVSVVNAILPACQGIFVSVLYCFINSEVQSAIRKKWRRCRTNRSLNTRSRRQGSRTSSYFLSQSDTTASRRNMAMSKTSLFQTVKFPTVKFPGNIDGRVPSGTISKDRDYHSMGMLNLTPEREPKKVVVSLNTANPCGGLTNSALVTVLDKPLSLRSSLIDT